jgi:hypothetical protein
MYVEDFWQQKLVISLNTEPPQYKVHTTSHVASYTNNIYKLVSDSVSDAQGRTPEELNSDL